MPEIQQYLEETKGLTEKVKKLLQEEPSKEDTLVRGWRLANLATVTETGELLQDIHHFDPKEIQEICETVQILLKYYP